MSEYSDLVMAGHLCEGCGVHLKTHGIEGFPQLCGDCANGIRKAGGQIRAVGNGNFQNITPIKKESRETN